jgi:hypothetical protein
VIGAATLAVAAQSQQRAPIETPKQPDAINVIGCVRRSDQSDTKYIIVDSRGVETNPQGRGDTYRLEGEASQLELHEDHLVEVRGVLTSAGSTTGPVASAPKLKALAWIWLASSCPKTTK